MNTSHPELAQAIERHALLLSHPAAADYPDLDQAIADAQARIDELTRRSMVAEAR
ncbi:MAG: hypothetical protein P8N02_07870 [Actinomycetota bacterium]|jgi:hypothetical protein|nr:hypothetical protein [Actinomycetota bacterium]